MPPRWLCIIMTASYGALLLLVPFYFFLTFYPRGAEEIKSRLKPLAKLLGLLSEIGTIVGIILIWISQAKSWSTAGSWIVLFYPLGLNILWVILISYADWTAFNVQPIPENIREMHIPSFASGSPVSFSPTTQTTQHLERSGGGASSNHATYHQNSNQNSHRGPPSERSSHAQDNDLAELLYSSNFTDNDITYDNDTITEHDHDTLYEQSSHCGPTTTVLPPFIHQQQPRHSITSAMAAAHLQLQTNHTNNSSSRDDDPTALLQSEANHPTHHHQENGK